MATAIEMHGTRDDAAEWKQLEKERAAMGWEYGDAVECGVKYAAKPHPQSYGAALPLRSELATIQSQMVRGAVKKTTREKKTPAHRPTISATKPHPDSYRPDLPLKPGAHNWQGALKVIPPATPEERALLAQRPLMVRLSPTITPEAKAKLTKVARSLSMNFATVS